MSITLVLDRPMLPGRVPHQDMLDYWPTPWLTSSSNDWISSVRLLYPPVKILEDGPNGPRLRERTLGLITLSSTRHESLPETRFEA
jgi:hypothetical protein